MGSLLQFTPIVSDNYSWYFTIGLLAPGCHGREQGVWRNSWANLAYMKYTQSRKNKGREGEKRRAIMLMQPFIIYIYIYTHWMQEKRWQVANTSFYRIPSSVPSSLGPMLLKTRERHINLCAATRQNTAMNKSNRGPACWQEAHGLKPVKEQQASPCVCVCVWTVGGLT